MRASQKMKHSKVQQKDSNIKKTGGSFNLGNQSFVRKSNRKAEDSEDDNDHSQDESGDDQLEQEQIGKKDVEQGRRHKHKLG